MTRYWMNTISLDHVRLGIEGRFTQAGHGSDTRLRRLSRGDGIAFYSPRTALRDGRPLQQLTALGMVADDEPFQVEMAGPDGQEWQPWRRRVDFEQAAAVPIRPLLPLLGFVTELGDERRWGMVFRRGLFELSAGDFGVVAGAMRDAATLPDEFSRAGRLPGA